MIKVLIVEDEKAVRVLLRNLIHEIVDDVEIIAECGCIATARTAIDTCQPDIVFLDIHLPGGTGLDLLEQLPDLQFEVIFVTAYDQYMLDAFKYAAIGYVLKPINKGDLNRAIMNATKRLCKNNTRDISKLFQYLLNEKNNLNKIGVPTQEGILFLNPEDIIRCEGCNSYTKIFLNNKAPITSSYNLSKFSEVLPRNSFLKVHRSHIISLGFVSLYQSKDSSIEMTNGDSVPLSKSLKEEFVKNFKIPHK